MTEREFVTYDGVKFRKYKGKEIRNTGHYKVEVEKVEDITALGTFLDDENNVKNFRRDFYNFINLKSINTPEIGFNYILIGKDYLYSFNHNILFNYPPYSSMVVDDLFEGLLNILSQIGLMNDPYEIDMTGAYKKIKIPMVTHEKPHRNFDLYFIPLDNGSINFTKYVIDKEDLK